MKMLFNEIASHNISKILECTQALGDKIELRVKGGLLKNRKVLSSITSYEIMCS